MAQHYNITNTFKELICLISKETQMDYNFVEKTIIKYEQPKKDFLPKNPTEKKSASKYLDHIKISSIRKKIHDMWLAGKVPTVDKIISAVNIDPILPRFNRAAIDKVLKTLKINLVPVSGTLALIEDDEVVRQRRNYLENIRKYRNEGRPIYFLGDTLIEVNVNDNDTEIDEKHSCTATMGAPSEKRKKFIILHIGSADGFVQGGLDGMESEKNDYDYLQDINSDNFMNWFKKVLSLIKENAVIVMNSSSFNMQLEVNPDKSWTNQKIIEWLESKGQIVSNDMIKVQLMDLVNKVKSENIPYLIDKIANENNKTVLRIPHYHSELNAIQIAWDIVKHHVNTNSVLASKITDIEKLLVDCINLVTPKEWYNIIEKTMARESDSWNVDTKVNLFFDGHIAPTMVKKETKSSNDDIEFILSKFQ